MGRLASELGIAKATLYRWTGSREQLIGEVLSYLYENGFDQEHWRPTPTWRVWSA